MNTEEDKSLENLKSLFNLEFQSARGGIIKMFIKSSEEYPEFLKRKKDIKLTTKRQEEIYEEYERLMSSKNYEDLTPEEKKYYRQLKDDFFEEYIKFSFYNDPKYNDAIEIFTTSLEENTNSSLKEEDIQEILKGTTER